MSDLSTILLDEINKLRMDVQHQHHALQIIRKEIHELSPENDKFVTVAKVAMALNLSSRRVRQLCETGRIKATQPGKDKGRWRIPYTEMERLKKEAKENHFNKPRV